MGILVNLLFPTRCAVCERILPAGGRFCAACTDKLSRIPDEKMLRESGWGQCVSVLYYDELTRESIHAFKFHGQDWRADAFAYLMAQTAAEHLSGRFDVVTWVPVSRRRLKERGYDQSRLLAEGMCRLWQTGPERLLVKCRDNPAQSSLEGEAVRRANVQGAYAPARGAAIAGRRILLVDDVLTTGSTMGECVRTLRAAGAMDVVGITLAAGKKEL